MLKYPHSRLRASRTTVFVSGKRASFHARRWMLPILLTGAGCGGATTSPPPPIWTPIGVIPTQPPQPQPVPRSTAVPASPPEEEDTDPAFADAPATPLDSAAVDALVKSLPLRSDTVSFVALDQFFRLYAPFTTNKVLIRSARRNFKHARALLRTDLSVYVLTRNVTEISAVVKDPRGPNALAFLSHLHLGLVDAQNIIVDFAETARSTLTTAQTDSVAGHALGTSSIARANLRDIETAKANVLAWMDKNR